MVVCGVCPLHNFSLPHSLVFVLFFVAVVDVVVVVVVVVFFL